jgi:hypothetical protein
MNPVREPCILHTVYDDDDDVQKDNLLVHAELDDSIASCSKVQNQLDDSIASCSKVQNQLDDQGKSSFSFHCTKILSQCHLLILFIYF